MSNTTEKSPIEQMFDTAYKQGFGHAIEFCESVINRGGSLYTAIEFMKEFIAKKYPELKVEETLKTI